MISFSANSGRIFSKKKIFFSFSESEPAPAVEKPRLKLRDSFTNDSTDADTTTGGPDQQQPIIGERSQALREIIRIHQQAATESRPVNEPGPPSPVPKAKLKDSFVIPTAEASSPDEEDDDEQPIEQRSESFQTIVKRHQVSGAIYCLNPQLLFFFFNFFFSIPQEQIISSTASSSSAPASSSPPLKRPGILKKPKDWSSPSPQEFPSTPVKEETTSSSSATGGRKQSIETCIEIQMNPSQASSIVVHEIPAASVGTDRRNSRTSSSSTSTSAVNYHYSTVQDVKVGGEAGRRGSTQQTMARKLSIDVEPSPAMHTTSLTLSTGSSSSAAPSATATTNRSTAGLVLSGDSSGHTVRSTSTFQLKKTGGTAPLSSSNHRATTKDSQTTSSSSFQLTQGLAALRRKPQAVQEEEPPASDPTPWRKKSVPSSEEPTRTGSNVTTTTKTTTKTLPATGDNSTSSATVTTQRSSFRSSYSSANKENPPPVCETTTTTTKVNKLPASSYQVETTTTKTVRSSAGLPTSGASSVRALAQKFLITGEEKRSVRLSFLLLFLGWPTLTGFTWPSSALR